MFQSLTGITLVYVLVALVVGIILHELMHGVMAYWLGDRTAADAGRLTLNPLASVDPVMTILIPFILLITVGVPFFAAKPVPFNPANLKWDEYGMALVGLAGPATNFVLAVIGALAFRFLEVGSSLQTFALYFAAINVGIMVFNLIPFPPLDGSRVLYAFAPDGVRRVMERIESMGFIFLIVIILLLFQFIAPVIGDVQQSILQFLLGQSV